MGRYTLAAKFASETIGTAMAMAFGLGVVANELLPKTKGHGFGFGFIAYGFGIAFFIPVLTLGFISAHLNPAVLLTLWIVGDIEAQDFFLLSLGELLGAFIGAVFVWLMYIPHFKTLDAADVAEGEDATAQGHEHQHHLLNPDVTGALPEGPSTRAKQFASFDLHSQATGLKAASIIHDARYFLSQNTLVRRSGVVRRNVVRDVLGIKPNATNSIQVAELHRRVEEESDPDQIELKSNVDKMKRSNSITIAALHLEPVKDENGKISPDTESPPAKIGKPPGAKAGYDSEKIRRQAAKILDQNIKLSVFATRPAIPTIPFNFLTELLGTFLLSFSAQLFSWVPGDSRISEPLDELYDFALEPLFISLLVTVTVMASGGPTGPSLNPARDLGPRIAHFLLPIHGKGPSEWSYAWIGVLGPFAGGALAGVAFLAIEGLDKGFED